MATRKQIKANRRNARKSTGPKSEAGKAASSANALSHGLTATGTVVLPEEEPEDFERLRQGVVADLAPAGALQAALAQRIAGLLWRLDRVARLEAELFAHGHLAKQRDSLARSETQTLVSRGLAEHLGEKVLEAQGKLDEQRRRIDMKMLMRRRRRHGCWWIGRRAHAPTTSLRATRRRCSARWSGRWRSFGVCATRRPRRSEADTAPEAAPADPDPAPSRDERSPAPQQPGVPAGGALHGGDTAILQNEANSAQRLEGEANFGAGANPPTAPPVV